MPTEFNIEDFFIKSFSQKNFNVPKLMHSVTEPGFNIADQANIITQDSGSTLLTRFNGVEIWLPLWFRNLPDGIGSNGTLFLPYTVVKIQGKKTIIKTQLAERRGSVKEQYNIDDYDISIKGFLIDRERLWPEKELNDLKRLYETNQPISLDNALVNIFLTKGDKVVIESFDCPEVEGGRKHVRPFSLNVISDTIFQL